jgi:ankyrin repeat protein
LTIDGGGINDLYSAGRSEEKNIGGHEQDNHGEASLKRHIDAVNKERTEQAVKAGRISANDGDKSKEQQKQEDESRNALHLATAIGDTDAVKDLLDGHDGKDLLNAADVNGWTPLHEAIRTGEVGVVK